GAQRPASEKRGARHATAGERPQPVVNKCRRPAATYRRMAWRLALSFARFMPESPIAEQRQPNNRADQRKIMMSLEFSVMKPIIGSTLTLRGKPLYFLCCSTSVRKISVRALGEYELRHTELRPFHPS